MRGCGFSAKDTYILLSAPVSTFVSPNRWYSLQLICLPQPLNIPFTIYTSPHYHFCSIHTTKFIIYTFVYS